MLNCVRCKTAPRTVRRLCAVCVTPRDAKSLQRVKEWSARNPKPLKPCRRCGAEKDRGTDHQGKHLCQNCKAMTETDKSRFSKYGLRPHQVAAMLTACGNVCITCDRPFSDEVKPCVDHCHLTGKVRGLLCGGCNTALGLAKENPKTLRALAAYAEEHNPFA